MAPAVKLFDRMAAFSVEHGWVGGYVAAAPPGGEVCAKGGAHVGGEHGGAHGGGGLALPKQGVGVAGRGAAGSAGGGGAETGFGEAGGRRPALARRASE